MVANAIGDATVRASTGLAYVECAAAFARAHREGRVGRGQIARIGDALDEAWRDMVVVELDERIAGAAVRLVREHALRASDAIHLASALAIASPAGAVTFACFDRRLWEAAGALGIDRLPSSLG